MAISQMQRNEKSPSKIKSKLKAKSTWDVKRNLVNKRLMSLSQKAKNEEAEDMDRPLICFKGKSNASSDPCGGDNDSTSAVDRAEEVRANLSPNFPSFSKLMLKSHVMGGFWLGLPKKFCNVHLPKHDETVVLVDEDGKVSETKYLVEKNGLSGGWRGFSIAHKLLEGDVIIFQLIEALKFKVYIVRASSLTELDGAIGLLNLDVRVKPIEAEFVKMEKEPEATQQTSINEQQKLPSAENHEKKRVKIILPISDDESSEDNSGSGIEEGIRISESVPDFKDVKCLEDFSIHVNGLILDSEIPKHLRTKYFELCLSQNMFLHDCLIEGLNSNLISGMISETINIADAIRAVKSTTPINHLESWDRTLKAFEDLGMVVGFLRDRINKLVNLSCESEAAIEAKKRERAEAEEVMRGLKERYFKIKGLMKGLDGEIEALKVKNEELGSVFKEVAGASW